MKLSIGRVPSAHATAPRRRRGRRAAGLTAGVLAIASLAACGSSGPKAGAQSASTSPSATASTSSPATPAASAAASSGAPKVSCSPDATKLTMWGWAAGYDLVVAEFNKTHPNICVTLQNNGAANDEYVKIGNALKAGSGAPDVAEVEYFDLPSFEITKSLVDLTQYGANDHKADIAPVAWAQASQGSAVYAMPVDLGPLVQYYNSDLLTKNNISVPTTWDEFASAAAKLHAANSTAAMANFDPTNAQAVLAMMQQDNAFPFKYTGGSNLTINFTGTAQMAFANYWQKLLDAHEVTTAADFSPEQWSNFDNGVNAVRFSPAWGPVGMQLSIKKTIGAWRAAPMPQATAGQALSGNWGGSTIAVFAQSKHPKEAAEFAEWFGGSADAWKILSGPVAGAFPAYLPLLNDAAFQARTLPISADSQPNKVFAQAAENMIAPQWPPIMTAALTQWTDIFAGVTKGTEKLPDAFKAFQDSLVKYAKAQGFTVSTS
jgi:multiple sugar transport system substrate-binding protein